MVRKSRSGSPKISPREAAEHAQVYLLQLVDGLANVTIEEVELDDDGRYWYITLGFNAPDAFSISRRHYKQFKVDAKTGEVRRMVIRSM